MTWPESLKLVGEPTMSDLAKETVETEQAEFDRLFARSRLRLVKLVSRLLAWPADSAQVQDVMQETMLRAWANRKTFHGHSQFETWVTAIAINGCRNHQRSLSTATRFVAEWIRSTSNIEKIEEDRQVERQERQAIVRKAIGQLRHVDREAIVLRYLEEHSIDEMASMLRLKRDAIDARLSRARKRLGVILHGYGIDGDDICG